MEGWETGVGMEYAGNEDFRDCSYCGILHKIIKNLSNLLLCHDGLLAIMM